VLRSYGAAFSPDLTASGRADRQTAEGQARAPAARFGRNEPAAVEIRGMKLRLEGCCPGPALRSVDRDRGFLGGERDPALRGCAGSGLADGLPRPIATRSCPGKLRVRAVSSHDACLRGGARRWSRSIDERGSPESMRRRQAFPCVWSAREPAGRRHDPAGGLASAAAPGSARTLAEQFPLERGIAAVASCNLGQARRARSRREQGSAKAPGPRFLRSIEVAGRPVRPSPARRRAALRLRWRGIWEGPSEERAHDARESHQASDRQAVWRRPARRS
jgi:hypothetical protein